MKRKTKAAKASNPTGRQGAPISLYGLSFEEAVLGLGQVKMPPKKKKPKAKPKKGNG